MKKKLLSILLTLSMCAAVFGGCGKKETDTAGDASKEKDLIVVGYSQIGAESDWRTANTESFKSTFTEANGYQLIFDDAQQKQENQIKAIRSFIQQEVDYIVVAPVVETGWETVLKEAKEAGIPVILSDRMMDVSDDSLYVCWVGGNFIKEGQDAAAWLKNYLAENNRSDETINIVTLQGTIGASAQIGRTEGFGGAMEANWNMLALQTGEFTQSKGQEVMESMLKQYDDIDVVIAENDNMAFGAIDAIKAAGKTCGPNGDIIIISFDAIRAAFEAMIAGDLNVSVECNPLHGPRVDEIIRTLESGKTVDKIMYVDEDVFPATTAKDLIDSRTY